MPWSEKFIESVTQLAGSDLITTSELVWHGFAALLWGGLAFIAWSKLRQIPSREEWLLGWSFVFGFAQELLILIVKAIACFDLLSPQIFQSVFPPVALSLRNSAIILVASGYVWYLAKQAASARTFARIGLTIVVISYLASFWWWGHCIFENTAQNFERSWCSGLMQGAMTILLLVPLFYLWVKQSGWSRYWASLAIFCFWLYAALSWLVFAIEMPPEQLQPVRRTIYVLGISWLGYVYVRELIDQLGKETQQQRAWKEQFEAFMDNSPFIAWVKDEQGEHRYLSQPYTLQIGIPVDTYVGKTDFELWPENIAKSHREMDLVALETGKTIAFESNHPLPSGEVKNWYVVKFPFTVGDDDSETLIGGIGLDVTDKKQAELDRDRFFEYSSELMCIADENMCFKRVNRAFEDVLGYRREDLISKSFHDFVHPLDRPAVESAFQKKRMEVKFISFETRYRCQDGSYRLIAWTTPLADDETGALSDLGTGRLFAVGRDVTDQRALELRLLKVADDEQQRIAHDLHDGLGQELTGLAMMAESLALNLKDRDHPEYDLANKISLQLESSRKLTQRLARGLRPIAIDSDGICSALMQLAERTNEASEITCSFTHRGEFDAVDPDVATQLYRIAQEAVSNAIRHAKPASILIHLVEQDGTLQLKIVDDGVGMVNSGTSHAGIGIKSMQYRSNIIGGELRVEPNEPQGTMVACSFKLN